MQTLAEKIDVAIDEHVAGLINGEELRPHEIEWWIELLTMADEHKTPVKRARFLGFTFINRRADIRAAIEHLTYS
jgi:hypothetical protein